MAVIVPIVSKFDQKGVKQAQSAFGGLSKSLKSTIGALGIGLGLGAITNGLKNMAKAATEDNKSIALLANTLRNTTNATDESLAANEEFIGSLQRAVAISDDQLRPALGKLAAVTGDLGKAQGLLGLATDLAAYKGVSLETATNAIAKAQSGQLTSLNRLVPEIRGAGDWIQALGDKTKNAAKIAAENDPFQRIKISVDEASESLGKILLPYISNFADYLASKDFSISFSNLTVSIGEAIKAFDVLFKGVTGKGAFQSIIELANLAAIGIAEIAFTAADAGTSLGLLFSGQFDKIAQRGSFFTRYNKFVDEIYAKQEEAAKGLEEYKGFDFSKLSTGTVTPVVKDIKKVADTAKKAATEAAEAAKEAADALAKETEALAEFSKELMDLADGVKPLIDLGREIGQFEQSTIDSFDAIAKSIEDGIGNGTIIARAGKNLLDYVSTERKALTAIAQQRDALASKRGLAEALIGDVKAAVVGFAQITDLVNQETGNLTSNFADVVSKTKAFATQLKQLRELGLDKNLYKQIVDAGIDAGGATAAEIIKGGAGTVGELNNLFSELEKAGVAIAEDTALVMFNNGVEVAGGLVAGLMSQEQALVDAATALADAFSRTFNSMVGNLKVPSQEVEQITLSLADIAKGNVGIAGANSNVSRSLASRYLNATGGQGAQNITITVKAGLGTDGKAVGQAIQAELNKYNRANYAAV